MIAPMGQYKPQIDLTDKTILVTGGTGSFGRCFTKTVLERYDIRKLIIFSRDEFKQFEMQNEADFSDPKIRFFIGDVRDLDRLRMAFRDVDFVIHAAALKHIAAAEYNPFECIQTNVHGAENVVRASLDAGVRKVVALSTDKAANPINLYGASKLASDKIFVAAKAVAGRGGPQFAVVRYGNVIGSRGSVIPLFRKLIDEGAPHLPITDPRMTRFWITLEQGVEFVLSCLETMSVGEIFVPKIPSMRITDLAATMAPGLPTQTTGIRPGEKLHEVMITADDARNTVEQSDRFVIRSPIYGGIRRDGDEILLEEGFSYTSDTNGVWFDAEQMRGLLTKLNLL